MSHWEETPEQGLLEGVILFGPVMPFYQKTTELMDIST